MDMYQKYTSPFGYQTGTGGIDTYGVNHNGFSLRDEIEYQFARQKRENELQAQYNAQGITENYPQKYINTDFYRLEIMYTKKDYCFVTVILKFGLVFSSDTSFRDGIA